MSAKTITFAPRRKGGDALPDKTPESSGEAVGIKIPGYPSISLPANQQDVEVALLNPEGNPCYFTFELVLFYRHNEYPLLGTSSASVVPS